MWKSLRMDPRCCVLFATFTRFHLTHVLSLLFARISYTIRLISVRWNQRWSVSVRVRFALRYASFANPRWIHSTKDNGVLWELLRAFSDAVDGPRGIRNLAQIGGSAMTSRRSVEIHTGDVRAPLSGEYKYNSLDHFTSLIWIVISVNFVNFLLREFFSYVSIKWS